MDTTLPSYNGIEGQTARPRVYACLYFPEWSIDVTRRALSALTPPLHPPAILLTTSVMNQKVVTRACHTARSHGVRQDMSTALALALAPASTYLESFNPVRDAQTLHTLAVWCLKFSPIVGLDGELSRSLGSPDRFKNLTALDPRHYGIAIDLTGTEKIHGDFVALSKKISSLLRGTARIAIAPSLAGAWALSRYGTTTPFFVRSLRELSTYVAQLPTAALRIDHSTCSKLSEVGIVSIGDLDHIPRKSLGQRFGAQLLCRMAQLYGSVGEQLVPVTPGVVYRKHATFEPPLTHRRAIISAIEHLFIKLLAALSHDLTAAKQFLLSVHDSEGTTTHKELSLASATAAPSHLQAIISPVIETLHFCGEVTGITLEARDTSRISASQRFLHGTDSPEPEALTRAYNELMNSFSVRLGRNRVLSAALTASYIPELSFRFVPMGHSAEQQPVLSPYITPTDRPPVLLSPPEPIISIAMLPDRPPSWIRWRGAKLLIIRGLGPERIAPEWWQGSLSQKPFSTRDYFSIQDQSGRWLWVFRCLCSQKWFVHGIWR
jgi:protein ImuB